MNTRYKIIEAGGFKFLKNPTEDELHYAVDFDGTNLQYITNQTNFLCLKALEQTEKAFPFIIKQNDVLCEHAVEKDGLLLKFVKNKSELICKLAVNQNGSALEYVDEQSYELCLLAVLKSPFAFKYTKNKTLELCVAQYNKWISANYILEYLKETYQIHTFLEAIGYNWELAALHSYKHYYLTHRLIECEGLLIKFIPNPPEDLCAKAVHQNGLALQYVENKTLGMCQIACENNKTAFEFVPENLKKDVKWYL